jgi:ABC transporter with metal-binding/Fe-S-binding domain ATP-binding protein
VGVLFSGGKDSTLAAHLAVEAGHQVACLITMHPRRLDSYMFHYPNVQWTRLQAEALQIPQLIHQTEGVKEEELRDLEAALALARDRYGIEGVYTGGLASNYQRQRFEAVAAKLGLRCLSPSWGRRPEGYLEELLDRGFRIMVVGVAAAGLGEEWLGRILDHQALEELRALHRRYQLHLGFEGGEAETFVLDAPLFKAAVEVVQGERVWWGDAGIYRILKARLRPKGKQL